VDSTFNTTTRGTRQDVDGLWPMMFNIALDLYVKVIEKLRLVAPVDVVFNPSNHDFHSGFALAQVIQAWFKNDQAVSIDASVRTRKYYTYGSSLIGTAHGDKGRPDSLPLLMAQEAGEDWVKCKYRYWYLHHIHHKRKEKHSEAADKVGVTLEWMRSPSGTDAWHDAEGYMSPKAVEGFIHSKDFGQVGRFTHYFKT